jgi:phosphohistidine phosphatase
VKTLIVVRHAKSDWAGDEPDRERPLGKRGRRQAPESGAWIAEHHPVIDLAVVSPAVRASTTWDLVAAELPTPPPVSVDERVYAAWDHELLAVVRSLSASLSTVALVGHNPGIEAVVEALTGTYAPMPTSCVAVIELADWDAPSGKLLAHGRPPA